MLFLLSPAKSLDYTTPVGAVPHTQPLFVPQAAELIDILQEKTPREIAAPARAAMLGHGRAQTALAALGWRAVVLSGRSGVSEPARLCAYRVGPR